MTIRPACEHDFAAIAAITNGSILREPAHFAIEPEPEESFRRAWLADGARHLWFVAEVGGAVVGYVKSYDWNPRAAYRWTCAVAVYVDPAAQGTGVGRGLYERLFAGLEAMGYRTVVAGITLPNAGSVALHERMGLRPIGVLPGAGYKMGAWRDVGYWAGSLGEGTASPPRDDSPGAL